MLDDMLGAGEMTRQNYARAMSTAQAELEAIDQELQTLQASTAGAWLPWCTAVWRSATPSSSLTAQRTLGAPSSPTARWTSPAPSCSAARWTLGGAHFSGGTVDFARAEFFRGRVNFGGAWLFGGRIDFGDAEFCGGTVDFGGAHFSGGTVDLGNVVDWSVPPVGLPDPTPPGITLPSVPHAADKEAPELD